MAKNTEEIIRDAAGQLTTEDEDEFTSMKVTELRAELKRRKLKTYGNKPELIARLKAAIAFDSEKDVEDENEDAKDDEDDEDENDEDEDDKADETIKPNAVIAKTKRYKEHSRHYVPSFKDVEESMETFSGDSTLKVERWLREFEETANLCEWTEVQKIIYAKRLLRGSAKSFVNFEDCGKTWKQLKSSLIAEFSQRVYSHDIHKQLTRRKKNHNESYQDYVYAMMSIASQVDIEAVSVIRYIINGIQDDETNKTILYGATNMREFKEKLRQYEEMKENIKENMKENMKQRTRQADQQKKKASPSTLKTRRCFNCGEEDHVSSSCPSKKKGVKCFRCNQFGHIASSCTGKVNKNINDASCDATESSGKRHTKDVIVEDIKLTALFDSGSDISLIRADKYIQIGAPRLEKRKLQFRGIGSENNCTLGETRTKIIIDEVPYDISLHVVSDRLIPYDMIIGSDFLYNFDVRMKEGEISIAKINDHDAESFEIFNIDVAGKDEQVDLSHIADTRIKSEVQSAIENYKPNKVCEVGVKMRIIMKDEIPIYQRPRRLSPSEKEEVNTQIKIWLNDGIIKPSVSEYASPIVLVKKKDGSTRICVDYRKLNQKILKDRYPLPRIDDQIDKLQDAKVYSTIDLKNGFFHTPIEESSTKYTAFVIPNGHFEFLRVPFGLSNSPAVFQKYINAIFKDLISDETILVYMDDLIIPSNNYEEGLHRLKRVLGIASKYGLTINWKKSRIMQTKILYLGHEIENGLVRPSEQKIKAVANFPRPTNVKAVQSFIGLTSYFRKFIFRYSQIARPLTDLLRDNVKFHFGEQEEHAFQELKSILTTKPVLRLYRVNAETQLHTDASALGYGAILLQKDNEDGAFHPVYYMSGRTTSAEERYTSYELEVLAIVKALKKFRIYLLGISFKIITDCKAFTLTMQKKDLCVRVARWALFLEEFSYTVEHRPRKYMTHVDALSRNPLPVLMSIDINNDSVLSKFRTAQREDDDLKEIFNATSKDKTNGYVIKNGILYKEVEDEYLIVVPKRMQTNIIKQIHERGHFAAGKTEKLLRRDYWFAKMRPKIEVVIKNCINCILAEKKGGKQEGFLYSIDKGDRPLETYHIDHLGPMTSTKKKYRYLFVVVDGFTKFTWLYPVKSTDTAEVLDRLKKQAAIFGNPKRIISDRGTAFTSLSFEEFCTTEGIQHVKITTGVPRSNGQVERINRILIPILSKLSYPKPEDWYKFVDVTQQYLNSTPSRSTGFSPFHLLVGTRMRIKEDPQLREILDEEAATVFQEERDEIRQQAAEAISKISAENRRNYNRKRKEPVKYKENDIVAIKRTQYGPGLKLHPKYLGPYRIVKILRNDRYVVEKVGEHEGPNKTSTSADYMKFWADEDEYDLSDIDDV